MKKVLGVLLAVFLCLGFAATSMASIDSENGHGIKTCKFVMICAKVFLCTSTAAESDAVSLQGNIATLDGASFSHPHPGVHLTPGSNAAIEGSASKNDGLMAVNNASGNLNNQGNTFAVANAGVENDARPASGGGQGRDRGRRGHRGHRGALSHAVAFAFQGNIINAYIAQKKTVNAAITDSVNDNTGIGGVNNAAGSQNNQTNTIAVAAGLKTKVALSVTHLVQVNALGIVCNTASVNNALISDSINSNSGIVGVNNSAGAQNNQANVIAVSGN